MTKKEYLSALDAVQVEKDKVEQLERQYGFSFPEIVKKVISSAVETIFFDDEGRILSFDEMVDAEADLHVSFSKLGLFPLADTGDNDFIVYHAADGSYSLFNIVDECAFRKRDSLDAIL